MAASDPQSLEAARLRHRRLCEAFDRLHTLTPDQREAELAVVAQEDAGLAAELAAMLHASESDGLRPRETPVPVTVSEDLGTERGYRILRQLGHGGMGRVLLAERSDGRFSRQVAIKVLDKSPDDDGWRRRFAAEREILARLVHPNIARLLDAGEDPNGVPYLVMEYVDGVALDRWMQQAAPSLPTRLDVFVQIAQAVAHAHQSLVAHRDLKPANILVDHQGKPHLLDFGIARLLSEQSATMTDTRALTPRYAAPEQVAGAPATVAVDIYQLGVLLFELLTGRTPFSDLSGPALLDAIVRREPPTPSHLAESEDSVPWARRLRGDLDAIVAKAMRREPLERYRNVDAMIDDVQRWRRGQPVLARQGGTLYRTRKFVRRHWLALATVGLIAALIAGFVWRLQQELARSEREQATAKQVTELMIDVLGSVDPRRAKGQELTLREALDQGVARIREQKDLPDAVRGRLLHALGGVYLELSQFDVAGQMLEEALPYRKRAGTPTDAINTAYSLAVLRQRQGRLEEAERWVRHSLDLVAEFTPDDYEMAAELHNGLAIVSRMRGRDDVAAVEFERAIDLVRNKVTNKVEEDLAPLLRNFAEFIDDRGDHDRARSLIREAFAAAEIGYPGENPERARLLRVEARNALYRKDATLAATRVGEAWAMAQRLFPEAHEERIRIADLHAQERWSAGDTAAAEALLQEVLAKGQIIYPDGHPRLISAATRLAALYLLRQNDAKVPALLELAERSRHIHGVSSADTKALDLLHALVDCIKQGSEDRHNAVEIAVSAVVGDPQFLVWLKPGWQAVALRCERKP
ncbi:serine/threonine-protein kinase [Tahibacter amnicola]|uniref:Serine/threonine-protein kinase n=1 Tax=Tahibacter amnicola TaxID=2976241 RepID=A0ABY6B8U9_9GAMM|nr:serine/threonine-protein kinase [Tahibacter amnicola]UXI66498.1 serine/threonine-protein kinase [Tahibacter amnicola]